MFAKNGEQVEIILHLNVSQTLKMDEKKIVPMLRKYIHVMPMSICMTPSDDVMDY